MSNSSGLQRSLLASALLSILAIPAALAQARVAQPPMYFEPNRGQAAEDVRYLLRDGLLSGEFVRDGVSLALPVRTEEVSRVRMQLLSASQDAAIEGQEMLGGHTNYLLGNDSSRWLRSVPNYAKVRYRGVYPGIDLVFYGNGHALEHDFEIQPGADPGRIAFSMPGARKLTLTPDGGVLVEVAGGEVRFTRPVAYQMAGDARQPVDAHFVLRHDGTVRFRMGRFDRSRALVIDPALDYATYLDTMGDDVSAVAADAAGNTYITGLTFSTTFPVTANAFQTKCPACADNTAEVFVTKLNPSGTAQVYSTFIGGSSYSEPSGMALDANGNAIVTGMTEATDFPVKNPVSSITNNVGDRYAFITSLSADGSSLNYSSVLGGESTASSGVAVDGQGAAYITGGTDSSAFPITSGALKAITPAYPEDAVFVSKFSAAGALVYSAILGDSISYTGGGGSSGASSIAVDSLGSAYIAGGAGALWPVTAGAYAGQPSIPIYRSVFVTKLKPDGSAIAYSTLLGPGYASSMALDASNNVYIAGIYDSTSFPVTAGAYEASATSCCMYFSKVNATGTQLLYSSFFGGTTSFANNTIDAIRLDSKGDIWLAGTTEDSTFPLMNPLVAQLPPAIISTSSTSFLSEFDSTGTKLEFSTFIGDEGTAGLQIALDPAGKVHAAGTTAGAFYTTPGAFIGTVPAPPQYVEYTYPYAELIDPAASGATVCLPSGENYGLSFGDLMPATSTTDTITIESCGSTALEITSITANNPAFTVPSGSNTCTGSIAVGSSCSVAVQFEPSAVQSYSGTLTITSNATVATTSMPLSGAGANPVASFGTGEAYQNTVFQPLMVGQTSPIATAEFYNNGPVPLTINLSQVTISGDFALASGGNCTATLAANSECYFAVTFTPTAAGTRTGFLSVSSNDPANPIVSKLLTGTAYSSYPIPTITALLGPSYPINGGSSPVSVSVDGTGFFPASVVYLNGVAQSTRYNSSSWLSFNLNPSALTTMGEIPVTVQNPSPGGGASASYPLIAYISIPLTANALTVDPVGGLLYAAIPSTATTNPNTVIPITPSTGALGNPIAVGSNPRLLAVSDDGSELYVASTGLLQRFNLKTKALERSFALPVDPMWGQTYVQEMHVVPGTPQSIVVELFANVDPPEDGLALYNDSGLVNWIPGESAVNGGNFLLWVDSFAFTSASNIYAIGQYGESFFYILQNSASGLTFIGGGNLTTSMPMVSGDLVRSDGTLLYTNDGQVWSPSTQQLLGTYLEVSTGNPLFDAASVIPETSTGHTYFLDTSGQYADYQAVNIDSYGLANFSYIGSVPFTSIYPPDVADLVRWGSNGFAFRCVDITGSQPSANQIVIVTSSLVTGSGSVPAAPVISTLTPTIVYSGGAAFTLQVNGSGFTSASTIVVNGTSLTTSYTSSSSLSAQVPASDLYEPGQLNVQVVTPAPGAGTSNYATVIISPGIALTPASLTFGNLTAGTSSEPQLAYLENESTNPLTVSSIAVSTGYTETNNCGSSLAANSSCTISVVLDPTSTGMISGTLTVSDSASSATQTVSLLGYSLAPYTVGAATGGSLSATVASGGIATYNLQLSGSTGFSGSVNLTCSGAPQYATCTVSPSSLTLTSGGTGTFAVSVSTETTTTAAVANRSRFELAGIGLLAVLLLPFVSSRKRTSRLWLGIAVLAVVCLGLGVTACGGGGAGGGGSGPITQTYTTPAGTYTLTLTASSGSATSTQSLTLVVH
ncbi:MAG: choice-of-anchor D domain-containing protein [Terracidiphilus sp.]|jgi:hypothetical protein